MTATKDNSIFDANSARVREGLRVLDESARFILLDSQTFLDLKIVRHQMLSLEREWGRAHLIASRRGVDAGLGQTINNDYMRTSLYSIIGANASRVAESLRTLEEFSKIYFPGSVATLEKMRHTVYNIEYRLAGQTPHFYLDHYFSKGCVYPLASSVEELLWLDEHGARILQIRDKNGEDSEIEKKVQQLCHEVSLRNQKRRDKTLIIINDNPKLAARYPVAGVHIGQTDGSIAAVRQVVGSNKIIGRSTHSLEQAKEAVREGADYLSIGPVFATPTKADYTPVGLDTVSAVAREANIPWLAIGGIDEKNAGLVRSAGAKNLAVVRSARALLGG